MEPGTCSVNGSRGEGVKVWLNVIRTYQAFVHKAILQKVIPPDPQIAQTCNIRLSTWHLREASDQLRSK